MLCGYFKRGMVSKKTKRVFLDLSTGTEMKCYFTATPVFVYLLLEYVSITQTYIQLMPRSRLAWSCWNYLTFSESSHKANIDRVSL
jgi:hypothetical protein